MNPYLIAALAFAAGAAAGGGGAYGYFKHAGRLLPAPSMPVKK